jgi:hypothetical protein
MVDQNGDSTVNSENNDVEAKSKLHLLCIQSKQVICLFPVKIHFFPICL